MQLKLVKPKLTLNLHCAIYRYKKLIIKEKFGILPSYSS